MDNVKETICKMVGWLKENGFKITAIDYHEQWPKIIIEETDIIDDLIQTLRLGYFDNFEIATNIIIHDDSVVTNHIIITLISEKFSKTITRLKENGKYKVWQRQIGKSFT